MLQELKRHADSTCSAATHIEVDVACPHGSKLVLSYFVIGTMGDIRLPTVTVPARSHGLWRHTCFEAFVSASLGDFYYEFNFAPSTQWAAYRFSSYRSGMQVATGIIAPIIDVRSGPDRYILQATLDLDCLPDLPRDDRWRLALSALIQDTGGQKSYWALAHPPGKPDFHHADCFAYALCPAVQP
jgi:hypothetical protein